MSRERFELFGFQTTAVSQLASATRKWAEATATQGPLYYPRDAAGNKRRVPLLAQLDAVTGAGKTPILASLIRTIGPGIIIWTTVSRAVIDQTYRNLSEGGRYRHLLPEGVTVFRDAPTPVQWHEMMEAEQGTTIWLMTVGSWNEALAPADDARLSIRRSAPDWCGDETRSPWELLGATKGEMARRRPLYVVYDEAHRTSGVQLEQLLDLSPAAFYAASGSMRESPKLVQGIAITSEDGIFGPIGRGAAVAVPTSDVVAAGLLKRAIRIGDFNADPAATIAAMVDKMRDLTVRASESARAVHPRALYVVEKSNSTKGEQAPPARIWQTLVERGVKPSEIAIYTNTKPDALPDGAELVDSIDGLLDRHRHVIFNKALQEGWDDPENYLLFFDGKTKSSIRVTQVVGRILRQPGAAHFEDRELNTAWIFLACEDDAFEGLVEEIKKKIESDYSGGDNGPLIEVIEGTSHASLPVSPEGRLLRLPVYSISGAAPEIKDAIRALETAGAHLFSEIDRISTSRATWRSVELDPAEREAIEPEVQALERNASAAARDHFIGRLRARNRHAMNLISQQQGHETLSGSMWMQQVDYGSAGHQTILEMADAFAATYERHARHVEHYDPDNRSWSPRDLLAPAEPRRPFSRAVHREYPTTRTWLNADELPFAEALDRAEGTWMRNPVRGDGSYGIPLPRPTEGGAVFYPDFLWWHPRRPWAIDISNIPLLGGKIAGKLVDLPDLGVAIVLRGSVVKTEGQDGPYTAAGTDGWTLVVRERSEPVFRFYPDLDTLLTALGSEQVAAFGSDISVHVRWSGLRAELSVDPSLGATTIDLVDERTGRSLLASGEVAAAGGKGLVADSGRLGERALLVAAGAAGRRLATRRVTVGDDAL